jgi:hypothetical protein
MEEYGGSCYYEFEILKAHELSKVVYSPRFETALNIFWQLCFKPVSKIIFFFFLKLLIN